MVFAIVVASPDDAAAALGALSARVMACQREVLESRHTLASKVLELGELPWPDAVGVAPQIRVVTEALLVGSAVRMAVALPVSKADFTDRMQGPFVEQVAEYCGGGCKVVLEEIADKPADFKGGGDSLQGGRERQGGELAHSLARVEWEGGSEGIERDGVHREGACG